VDLNSDLSFDRDFGESHTIFAPRRDLLSLRHAPSTRHSTPEFSFRHLTRINTSVGVVVCWEDGASQGPGWGLLYRQRPGRSR
jgi:hypothetical protein